MQIHVTLDDPEKWKNWVNLDDLIPVQGNLKKLTQYNFEKLESKIKKGFKFPFFIWADKGKIHLLDGHQRRRVLLKLRSDGYEIPPLPFVPIFAKDYEEAKITLLDITSQFGEINEEGWLEYSKDINIDRFDVNFSFPGVEFDLDVSPPNLNEDDDNNNDDNSVFEGADRLKTDQVEIKFLFLDNEIGTKVKNYFNEKTAQKRAEKLYEVINGIL